MGISKITRNFQVTLPKDVRNVVGISEGDSVVFVFEGNKVVLQKLKENPIMASAGVWNEMNETGEKYQKKLRAQWKKRQEQANW